MHAGNASGWLCLATNATLPVHWMEPLCGYLLHHMEAHAPVLVSWYIGLCIMLSSVAHERELSCKEAFDTLFSSGKELPIQVRRSTRMQVCGHRCSTDS